MGRRSSIERMAPEVRDWIGRLTDQGRTLDEIIAKLRELDVDKIPSRSALHRHLKRAQKLTEHVRNSRTVAEVLARNLGEGDDSRVMRGNIEVLHSIVMNVMAAAMEAEDGEDGGMTFSSKELMELAKALDHLAKANKDDVARTVLIEQRAAEKARRAALSEAANTAVASAREAGASQEALASIRRGVLGLRVPPASQPPAKNA